MSRLTIERRLASFRAGRASSGEPASGSPARVLPAGGGMGLALGERLAESLDAELVRTPLGTFVRHEPPSRSLPVDRDRLSGLPGQPPPGVPLICLDTETTGLATAAGTVAFLVGLGWWEADRFRQVQLLLPDHGDEPALLAELARRIPANAWLVTYNGRAFDWPLLVARYRLSRRLAPLHAGHLDLLPLVRRVFRHRLADARLKTVETELLGLHRQGDVEGWEIPGRYLDFLRGGPAAQLVDVVRHNDEDVRSLARLIALVERQFGDAPSRATARAGDLAGLARAYARERRLIEALDCLDAATEVGVADPPARDPFGRSPLPARPDPDETAWLSFRRRPDFGGRPSSARGVSPWRSLASAVAGAPWTAARIAAERARLLRRLGRHGDAESAWRALAELGGATAAPAWIEVAKLLEHRLSDPAGALDATLAAARLPRRGGWPAGSPSRLDRELAARAARLRRRLGREIDGGSSPPLRDPNTLLGQPDRVVDPLGTCPGTTGALDPPQVGALR